MDKHNDPKSGVNKRGKTSKKKDKNTGKSIQDKPNRATKAKKYESESVSEKSDDKNSKSKDVDDVNQRTSPVTSPAASPFVVEDIIDGFSISSFICIEDLEDYASGNERSYASFDSSHHHSAKLCSSMVPLSCGTSTSSTTSYMSMSDCSSPEPGSSGISTSSPVNYNPAPSATPLSDLPGTWGREDRNEIEPVSRHCKVLNDDFADDDSPKLLTSKSHCNKKARNEDYNSKNGNVNCNSTKVKKDSKGKKKGKVKLNDKHEKMEVECCIGEKNGETINSHVLGKEASFALDSSVDKNIESQNDKQNEKSKMETEEKGIIISLSVADNQEVLKEEMDTSSPPCNSTVSKEIENPCSRSRSPDPVLSRPQQQQHSTCNPDHNINPAYPHSPSINVCNPKSPNVPLSTSTVGHISNKITGSSNNIEHDNTSQNLYKHKIDPDTENVKPTIVTTSSSSSSSSFNSSDAMTGAKDNRQQFSSNVCGNEVKCSSIKVEKEAVFSPKNHHAFLQNNKISVGACCELSNKVCTSNNVVESGLKSTALKKLDTQISHSGPLSPLNRNFGNQPSPGQPYGYGNQHTVIKKEVKKEEMLPPADYLLKPQHISNAKTNSTNNPQYQKYQHLNHTPHQHLGINTSSEKHYQQSYSHRSQTEKHSLKPGEMFNQTYRAADASAPVKNVPSHLQFNNNSSSGIGVNRAPPPPLTLSSSNKNSPLNPNHLHSGVYPYINNHNNSITTTASSHSKGEFNPVYSTTTTTTVTSAGVYQTAAVTSTTATKSLNPSTSSLQQQFYQNNTLNLSPKTNVPASSLPSTLYQNQHHKLTSSQGLHLPPSASQQQSSVSSIIHNNSLSSSPSPLHPHYPRVSREQPKPIPGLSGTRLDHNNIEQHSNRSSQHPFLSPHLRSDLHNRDTHSRKETSPFYPLKSPVNSTSSSSNLVSHPSALPSSYPLPSHPPHPRSTPHHISPTPPSLSSLPPSLHAAAAGTTPLGLNPLSSQPSISPFSPALSLPLPLHREQPSSLVSLHSASLLGGGSHGFNTASMFAPPLPPLPPATTSLPLPSVVPPYVSDGLPNPELLSQAQRDLNNRFLQDRLSAVGAGLGNLSPYIRAEMHNHQHQHLHQHNHTHLPGGGQSSGSGAAAGGGSSNSVFPPPPSSLLAPTVSHLKNHTPPTHNPHHHHHHHHHPTAATFRPLHPSTSTLKAAAAEMDNINKPPSQSSQYDKLPKLDSTFSPFRSPSSVPGLPGYTGLGPLPQLPGLPPAVGPTPSGLGSGLQGAFQPKNLPSTPSMHHAQLLMTLRDREKAATAAAVAAAANSPASQSATGSATPSAKKSGKWCAAHVRIAWEIHMHQQKQKAESAVRSGIDHKPSLDPLGGPPHPSHLLPTSLASAGLQGLHRPEMASSLLAASPHNRSPFETNPPGHPAAASLLSPAHLALSQFARPSPYQLPGLGGAAAAAAFGGLAGITPNGLYPPGSGPTTGRDPLPVSLGGMGNPQEWNRLHRTPPSFPQPPSTFSKSDIEKEKDMARHQREGSRDREREAVERDRELREKEREREYGISRQSPLRLDSREHHSSGRSSLDIERLREKERSECNSNSRDSFTERSRSRSPLRNGPSLADNNSSGSKLDSRNGTPLINSNKVKEERKDDIVIVDDRDHREKQNGFRHDILLGGKSDLRGYPESYLPPSSLSGLERSRFLSPFAAGSGTPAGLWNHYDIERQRMDIHREFERQKEHMLSRISSLDRERLAEYERHKSGIVSHPPPSHHLRLLGGDHPGYGLHSGGSLLGVSTARASPLLNHTGGSNNPHANNNISSNKSVVAPPTSLSISTSGGIPPPPLIPTSTTSSSSAPHSHSNSPTVTKSKPGSPMINNIDVVKDRPTVNGIDVEGGH